MRVLLVLLLSLSSAFAAITEKYVNSAGSGAKDGSSEANATSWTNMLALINAGGKGGTRYNIKGAISRTTTADTISGSGTNASPVILRGYTTAITDGYQGRGNTNGPLNTANMAALSYTSGLFTISGNFIIVESIRFTSTRNGTGILLSGTDGTLRGCSLSDATSGASGITLQLTGARALVQDCDVALSNGGGVGLAAVSASGSLTHLVGNRITSSGDGVRVNSSSPFAMGNIIFKCAGVGITNQLAVSGSLLFAGNTVTGCTNDAIGMITGASAGAQLILNNCLTDNAGYAVNAGHATNVVIVGYNRTRDNTLGDYNLATDWITATSWGNVTTDTGGAETDYVNAAGNDYRLIAASPAKGVGLPQFLDMGALQRQEAPVSFTFGQ